MVVAAAVESLGAINLNLTTADIERALAMARDRESARARFHAPYLTSLGDPTVQSLEIVSEYRRLVMLAEDGILKGDRGVAYSSRLAEEALRPWKGRVAVVARLRFHPLHTYVGVPNIQVAVDGPRADEALIGVLKEPIYALASGARNEQVPLVGAVAEGVFDAAIIGQTQRTVTVTLDGKDIVRVRLDFGSVD